MQSGSNIRPNRRRSDAGPGKWLVHASLSVCLLSSSVLGVPMLAVAKSRDNACPFADGQPMAKSECLSLTPKQASEAPSVEQASMPQMVLRKFCPNLVSHKRDANGAIREMTIELSPRSTLYDVSDCCPETSFTLTTEPVGRRFTLLGVGRDCFGGTAHFAVEETYRLDKDGKAFLLRRVDKSDTEWKLPTEP